MRSPRGSIGFIPPQKGKHDSGEGRMSAVISKCGQFRYRLEREIGLSGPVAAVIMVNPSTADASLDDATIRRVVGFGKRFGWSKVLVGNVFAFRATDVGALAEAKDPVGPDNLAHLTDILNQAETTIVAWGPLAKLPSNLRQQWKEVVRISNELGKPLQCLASAKDGHPRHPLMLSYEAVPFSWAPPVG